MSLSLEKENKFYSLNIATFIKKETLGSIWITELEKTHRAKVSYI